MQHPSSPLLKWAAAPALAVSLLLTACGGDDDGTTPPTTGVETPQTPNSTVAGTVLDTATGQPVAGVTVKSGDRTTTSDNDGRFSVPVVAGARAVLTLNKTAYAENVVVTNAVASQTTTVTAQLLPVATTGTVDPAAGGTVTVPNSPARVTLPAASLVRADGLPISGSVTVSVTPIDPAVNPAYMPGDFRARTTSGLSSIESYGAMTVTLADTTGARVNVATGKSATIRIPLSTRGTPTPSIPLFWFDATKGEWVEEGTATLAGTAPNQYYEGTVTHFTTWNADQYVNTVNITGCLKDEAGAAVAGARIVTDGIDYSGTASALTDASGNFVVPMKRQANGTVTAQSGVRFSNTVSVTSGAADSALSPAGTCLVLSSVSTGLTIKLTWGRTPFDVDSHLFAPNGDHVYFGSEGSLTAAPFAALDVDDMSSFGPEVITVRRLMVGTYRYAVNNYSKTTGPGLTGSPTRVELNNAGSVSVFTPPTGEGADTWWWSVFSFTVDAQCRITVTPVNSWSASEPAESPTANPTYCTAP